MNQLSRYSGVIILAALAAMAFVDGNSVNLASKWIPFLGHFHPVLLHLPIGLFIGVALLELIAVARPAFRVPEVIRVLLSASFYTAAISSLFGILLSWEGGYESEALNLHKWGGIATVAAFLGLESLFKRGQSQSGKLPATYLAGLVASIAVISATGHFGGSLTHGSGFLTQFNPFASDATPAEITENTPVYISHIQPIFEDYCYQCHSTGKIKGELRLDSLEMILAGGLNGPAIVTGDSENSRMIHAIQLPLDHDEHMPPKGRPQPSDETAQLLSWWIDQGASETARLDDLEITPEIATHFLKIDVLELQPLDEVSAHLEVLKDRPNFTVNFLAQNDSRLSVRGKNGNDEDLSALLPIKSNIVELNLGRSSITDAGLESVGQMTNLTHLHLNNTAITDAGVERLADLYQLEYINLFGTAVSDDSLLVLRRLKNLKSVFLWETNVTREAIDGLRKSIFQSVESEKLRLQILELTKERDSLEVDIVSAFDIELPAPSETEESADETDNTISDLMIDFHKGDNSIAAQAKEGKAAADALQDLLDGYQAISKLSPPKGSDEDWKTKTTELIEATNDLITLGGAVAIDRYKEAVNCKACHSEHRID